MPQEDPENARLSFKRRLSEVLRDVRTSWRHPFVCNRQGRHNRRTAVGQGRKAEDRGYGPAQHEANGDLRRRIRRRRVGFHQAAAQGRASPSSCGSTSPTCTCTRIPRPIEYRTGWPLAVPVPRHDDRSRQERRADARSPRRAGHRRQHLRDVFDRQRPASQFVAGWRHDAVPQREEHQLGRRLPHPATRPLAWQGQGRIGRERHRAASRLVPDVPRDGGRARRHGKTEEGLQAIGGPTRTTSTASICCRTLLAGKDCPRKFFFYFNDDGDVLGMRFDNWKMRLHGAAVPWHVAGLGGTLHPLRIPKLFNLRTDPYECADVTSNSY